MCEGVALQMSVARLDGLFSKIRLSGIFDYPNDF